MTLDTPTLFTCVMIAEFAGCLILLLFLLFWKSRSPACTRSLVLWSSGMFLAGGGTLLIAMRGVIPDGFSIIAANTLIIMGTGLRRSGFAAFLGLRPFVKVTFAVAVLWLALCFYPPFRDDLLARVNFVQTYLILTCLSVVWMAFREQKNVLYTARLLGLTTLIECAGYMWFTVNQNVLDYADFTAAFHENFMTIYLVTVLFSMIMTILLPACMVVERSLQGFKEQAYQDSLTGLPNRRAFLNDAESWLEGRKHADGTFSLIMFDLDNFKSVNDRFSHAMGDAVLQLFGRVLKDMLGNSAIPGRIGGEEFAVFLPGCGKEMALLTTQRICRRFSVECQEASQGKLIVTTSVGLVAADGKVGLERVMEAADRGLYKAKRQGRAQIVTMDLAPNGRLRKSIADTGFSSLRRKAA